MNKMLNHSASAPALITGHTAGFGLLVRLCIWRPEHNLGRCALGDIVWLLFLICLYSHSSCKSHGSGVPLSGNSQQIPLFFPMQVFIKLQAALLIHVGEKCLQRRSFSNFRREQNGMERCWLSRQPWQSL